MRAHINVCERPRTARWNGEAHGKRALAEDDDVHVERFEVRRAERVLVEAAEADEIIRPEQLDLLARLLHLDILRRERMYIEDLRTRTISTARWRRTDGRTSRTDPAEHLHLLVGGREHVQPPRLPLRVVAQPLDVQRRLGAPVVVPVVPAVRVHRAPRGAAAVEAAVPVRLRRRRDVDRPHRARVAAHRAQPRRTAEQILERLALGRELAEAARVDGRGEAVGVEGEAVGPVVACACARWGRRRREVLLRRERAHGAGDATREEVGRARERRGRGTRGALEERHLAALAAWRGVAVTQLALARGAAKGER